MMQPSPSRGRSASAAAGSAGGGMMMMMPQQQGPGIMFTTGTVDPCVVLQEQLDLERRRNEELREELVRKDRIILGAQLSEVERERRDMNLRLRCLEAMAAYRAKTQKALQNQTQYLQSEQF